MIYLLDSEYNQRLFQYLSKQRMDIRLIQSSELNGLESNDLLISDVDLKFSVKSSLFLLKDKEEEVIEAHHLYKYLPLEELIKKISDKNHLVFSVITLKAKSHVIKKMEEFIKINSKPIIIDCSYKQDSSFNLYMLSKKTISERMHYYRSLLQLSDNYLLIEPICNVTDFLNPPIHQLKILVEELKTIAPVILISDFSMGAAVKFSFDVSNQVIFYKRIPEKFKVTIAKLYPKVLFDFQEHEE